MKKIAIVVDNGPSDGGTFQYNQTIVDAFNDLPENQFEKIVFYTNDFWKAYLQKYPYTFIELKLSSRLKKILKLIVLLKLPIRVRKGLLYIIAPHIATALNKTAVDLLLFPSQDTISLFTSIPKISVIHDLMHRYESHFPEVSENGRIRYRDILFKSFCDESKAVVVDSQIGVEHVVDTYHINKDKVYTLPFIPPPHILSDDPLPNDFENKYPDLPSEYLFYPGQFWPHKNHKNLLLAISSLKKKGTNINIVFGGKTTYDYNKLVQLIEEQGLAENVKFVGFIPDEYLKLFYLKAKGLVMPTYFGPTNIPPLEAIFLNCPVAVSGIYGMPEQLQNAALYFTPSDVDDIAEKIKDLWLNQSTRDMLVANGIELTKHWNKIAFNKKFGQIIESVMYAA